MDAGERVLALSLDPAHSLGDALGVELGPEPTVVEGVRGLSAFELDAELEKARFLEQHRPSLLRLLEGGTYLEQADIESFLGLSLPGVDELAALLRLMGLITGDAMPRVVIDTAPTGHTLRLLSLPRTAQAWLNALRAMEAKHRAVAEALAGTYPGDEATRFLAQLGSDLDRLAALLIDAERTRFVLVTTGEPVVLAETRRLRDALAREHLAIGGVLVNRAAAALDAEEAFAGLPIAHVPLLPQEPCGPEGLRRFAAAAHGSPLRSGPRAKAAAEAQSGQEDGLRVGQPFLPPADRRIYLVGGKGGVGKTTIASAVAVHLARETGGRVLLLSTDPAGSLTDVFGTDRPAGVELRQVEAKAAWESFRQEYRAETERLFANLLGRGLTAEADRRVVERLVDLAPPGVDELMAMLEVVDLAEVPSYNALVLDTAPTGHLLRLLEMPSVGIEWAHALLRLLLKYREVVGLGEMAERILGLARALRSLRARLADRARTMLLIVALPESLSIPETGRLLSRLERLGLVPGVLIVNRLLMESGEVVPERVPAARRLLQLEGAPPAAGAPEWEREPRGVEELLKFAQSWRRVEQHGS